MTEADLLRKLIRACTFARLQRYLRKSDLTIKENIPENMDGFYSNHISIIMLWGMIGSINLKIHFNKTIATGLTAIGQNMPAKEITEKMAQEYMKEFSNNQAGYLKGYFEKNNILMGMSLPFLADGKDEIVFRKIRDPRAVVDIWTVRINDFDLVFTSEICLLDTKSVSQSKDNFDKEIESGLKPQNLEDDGDINFL